MLTTLRFLFLPRLALIAEILFLRKQLALFQERKLKPRQRTTKSIRLTLVALAHLFDWRATAALVIVKPETFLRWHRTAFRAFWRWKSHRRRKPGRPPLPANIRSLIREMYRDSPQQSRDRQGAGSHLKTRPPRLTAHHSQIHWPPAAPHFEKPPLEHLRS